MGDKEQHIAIVGAGLVGSLMAIYLSKRGYKISVFERRKDMRKGIIDAGRSINLALSNRGIRALKEVGLMEAAQKITIPMHGRIVHDTSSNIHTIPYGKQGEFINSIPRADLNILLIEEAEKEGAKFHFEHRVISIDHQNTSIQFHGSTDSTSSPTEPIELTDSKTPPTSTLQHSNSTTLPFSLIIGADGAFSAVRSSLQHTDRFNFTQQSIDHGYKEFNIPPDPKNKFKLEKNGLHIWPRDSFMMIALPNPDGSFTATLFYPWEGPSSFQSLTSDDAVKKFFESTFPDFLELAPNYLQDFNHNPTSSLTAIQCWPWSKNKTLLIGDAAHAIVPFYGQGMNAGFEDCRVLNQLLEENNNDWTNTLTKFQHLRKPDTDVIAKLALDNFIEMRDLVADEDFKLRKKIESKLHSLYPDQWIPLYSMVTFHDEIRYSEAYAIGLKQTAVMEKIMAQPDIHDQWELLDFKSIVDQL